jgi:peptidoglycan/LPS O-acetylase OafA/YrhL
MNLENRREARFYRPELDALRFFAFLCVFFFHRVDYLPIDRTQHPLLWGMSEAGAFGVPVFFLLSSFLIVELLLRERAATGSVHIKSFYARRILRIWPLYFAACYGLIILGRFLPNVGPKDPRAWLAFTFFAGNWYILRHGWIASAFDPLWSIAIEEQFYITVPCWGLQHTAGMLAMLDLPAASLSPVGTVLVLALTIAAAAGSYHFFERPFLRLKQRFTFVRSRPE